MGNQHIHIVFVFEIALLDGSVIQLHHKVGNGTKDTLAGKTALAHGHPLKNPLHAGQGHIVIAIDVKAV